MSEDGLPVRRVQRRLESYEPSVEEYNVKGKPLSKLEITGLQMRAKADVAHCLRTCPTGITNDEVRQRRAGHYVQTIPLKRRAEMIQSGGNRLNTYTEVLDNADSASQFRVPSRRFSILPRQQTISPEPVTPAAVMEPPSRSADAKSPTKRSPRHKSPPIKTGGPRISEPSVKLLPANTPKIEPSPTKSASPPPVTPLSESRSWRNYSMNATPSTFPKAAQFGTAFGNMKRFSAIRPGACPWQFSPTKLVVATPCPTSHAVVEASAMLSPVKLGQLAAQTPSKSAAGAEPATPRIFTNLQYLTADVPSPISFLPTLFSQSPVKQQQLVDLETDTPQKPASFDFGTTSPLFNSVTWLRNIHNVTQPAAGAFKRKGSRRQSEPLVRNFLKLQSRRQTISPRKLVFKASHMFNGPTDGLFSPVKKRAQTKTPSDVELSSAPAAVARPTGQSFDGEAFPAAQLPTPKEVADIDMRENPDIFSSKPVSLSLSPVMGAVMPSIAESYSEEVGTENARKAGLVSPSADFQKPDTEALAVTLLASPAGSTLGGLGIFDNLPEVQVPVKSIEIPEETVKTAPVVIEQSPNTCSRPAGSQKGQQLSPSPTLNLSFTPVNSRSPTGSESAQQADLIPESPPTVTTEIVETISAQSHDYDSPGRDYMREFIRRSRPKRPSTTEAGSPVRQTARRKPLGPKSPNTESPNKSKRKHEKDHNQHETPPKKLTNASPKKIRRSGKASSKTLVAANENDEDETKTLDSNTVSSTTAIADEDEDDAEMDGEASRRSSRLRSQQTRLPSIKSAIPTPIKIGRNSGPTLNSAVRSEQQELTSQTRMNTLRNRGNAEYPAQFLARQSEEAQTESEPEPRESSSENEGRKCVNWSNPLAMYQEDNQDRDKETGRTSKKAKNTATAAIAANTRPKSVQMSGIAKPVTRAKTTADRERTARLAEHFGMVSNGTPAKPQRSTRSRMRI
ncbi:hypothetical protein NQ176_g4632 [Zarea fungicola]|uniref:Uncharacterized protein n=1 Tax=Zarea fungicola TaxID=93591 RepID=A0ACC1NDU2_9HYPO|nr:hypothetical protein NQ176_g4632 [Lecanicillium fungicola]